MTNEAAGSAACQNVTAQAIKSSGAIVEVIAAKNIWLPNEL